MVERNIVGHLNWETRGRYLASLAVVFLIFGSLGIIILRPWDPFGAISLQLVSNKTAFFLQTAGVLVAACVFATLIFDARLPLFGLFAACVGIGLPIIKTGQMSYVMVRLQEGKELEHTQDLWGFLTLETLAWSGVLILLLMIAMAIEKMKPNKSPLLVLKGLAGTGLTVIVALFLVGMLAGDMKKGQIIFAVIAGFFFASLLAEQIAENDHPVWQVLAVPIVAMIVYIYTGLHPDRPPGMEEILHIAPNNWAQILPIEYIFIAPIGAIYGNWTSHRVRYAKSHD